LETVLEDLSFQAPEMGKRTVMLDAEAVRLRLTPLVQNQDLSRFIL
jgi:ATP-dependent HslUV protease ATP-binding subunit HslU